MYEQFILFVWVFGSFWRWVIGKGWRYFPCGSKGGHLGAEYQDICVVSVDGSGGTWDSQR